MAPKVVCRGLSPADNVAYQLGRHRTAIVAP
jgi:hypothetical protein